MGYRLHVVDRGREFLERLGFQNDPHERGQGVLVLVHLHCIFTQGFLEGLDLFTLLFDDLLGFLDLLGG